MRRLPALRRWQREALERFEASGNRSFLAVATPGAGKTVFALMAARRALVARQARGVVVVVPTAHLKSQWADAAEGFGLLLEPEWSAKDGLPRDMHGIVVTYQQVAANPEVIAAAARDCFGILDEIHHAGESRAWGDCVRIALGVARRQLCISGTPFRSDDMAIPFIRYLGTEAEPDYEYGYGDALHDRAVVRPVYFPRINGHMEWRNSEGREYSVRFDDPLGGALASQRLRTALSVEGEWMPTVLAQAHHQLTHLRENDPRAGGLVIATSQEHARGIAKILRERTGARPVVATSDDPLASRRIAEFRESKEPWLVAVRMVSEGVDIPRLRVGVYATTTMTDLFFRQAVGRLVRWSKGSGRQSAFMFIPDDARIRHFALDIKRSRRHSLKPPEDDRERFERDDEVEKAEQIDLFSVIGARALDVDGGEISELSVWDDAETVREEEAWQPELALELETTGPVPLPTGEAPKGPPPRTARQQRRQLRERNKQIVVTLARLTKLSHAVINKRLNAKVGLKRISEATERDLERRLSVAEDWIRGANP